MSDENKGNAPAEGRSIVEIEKELKAEMNRKLDGLKSELQQSTNQTQAMMDQYLAAINARAAGSQAAPAAKKLADLQYEDPDAYEREIENRAARIANEIVDRKLSSSNATQTVINSLASEYPELKDINSELSQEALKVYQTLPKHLQGTPEGTRMAIREAAALSGVVPVSKRKASESEEFSVSSGSPSRRASSKKEDVDDKTLVFAQAIGLNTNDPKILENLKKNTKRDYRKLQE